MEILKRDPCYGKIPPDRIQPAFDTAWSIGEREAKRFLSGCPNAGDAPMVELLKRWGFSVKTYDEDYIMGNTRYFCEYLSGTNEVKIYQKSIQVWAEHNGLSYEKSLDLILAHEYFHYLEWHEIGLTSKCCLVPMLKLGPLSLGKTGISALSEIGANAFANYCYLQWGTEDPAQSHD